MCIRDRSYVLTTDNGQKVKFDGYESGQYHEAKGPGYAKFVDKDGEFKEWFKGSDNLADQAKRQVEAADGRPVIWSIAEPETADAIDQLLTDKYIDGIIVKTVPKDG